MGDLDRLRALASRSNDGDLRGPALWAADEIARLREERRGLVEALRPFANYRGSDEYLKSAPDDGYCSAASFTAGAYRNARAMIAAADDGGKL